MYIYFIKEKSVYIYERKFVNQFLFMMEAPKEYGKISIGLENRVIPAEQLENTPSRKHGVSEELERDLRVVGCEYIQSAGLLLKLPQVNTSAIFLNMF